MVKKNRTGSYFVPAREDKRSNPVIKPVIAVVLVIAVLIPVFRSINSKKKKLDIKKKSESVKRLLNSRYSPDDSITIGELHEAFFKAPPFTDIKDIKGKSMITFSQDIKIGRSEVWTKLEYILDIRTGRFKPGRVWLRNHTSDHMLVISTLRLMNEYRTLKGDLPFTGDEFAKLAVKEGEDTSVINSKIRSILHRTDSLSKEDLNNKANFLGIVKKYRDCTIEKRGNNRYRISLKKGVSENQRPPVIMADYSGDKPAYFSLAPLIRRVLHTLSEKGQQDWHILNTSQ